MIKLKQVKNGTTEVQNFKTQLSVKVVEILKIANNESDFSRDATSELNTTLNSLNAIIILVTFT